MDSYRFKYLKDNTRYLNFHEKYLLDTYLIYLNDYLTLGKMADHRGINVDCLLAMVDEGKKIHTALTDKGEI